VREAISQLQANRLVETRHGVGTFALAPQPADRLPNRPGGPGHRIRRDSGAGAAPFGREDRGRRAGRATPARRTHLEAMQAMLDAFAQALASDSDAVPSDFQFHMEVARATGNRRLRRPDEAYLGTMVIPRTRVDAASSAPEGRGVYLQRVHGEHENIFNAIRNQDAEAARAAMRTHLSNSKERLKSPNTMPTDTSLVVR